MHFLRRLRGRARQLRTGLSLATRPASTKRVRLSYRPEEIAEFVAGVFSAAPGNRWADALNSSASVRGGRTLACASPTVSTP